jgi:F-type H+-transporting ATPase subunit epsilon
VATLEVDLVAADHKVWSGTARLVIARTLEGEIGIMAGHEPTLSVLQSGPVVIRAEDGPDVLAAVHGGFISVSGDKVTVLAETAELAAEIDVARARAAADKAGEDEAARQRAEVRLRVAESRSAV